MIIQSQFKDYYDFVAQQYGGGDPKIIYERKPFTQQWSVEQDYRRAGGSPRDATIRLRPWPWDARYAIEKDEGWQCKWLCVAGKYYLLVNNHVGATWTLFRKDHIAVMEFLGLDTPKQKRQGRYWVRNWLSMRDRHPFDYYIAKHPTAGRDQYLIEFHRKIQAAVFTYTERGVDEQIPILADLGFPKLIDPYSLYQDLSYFVGNLLHESPDMKPPVEVSNADKIHAAGFDLKQSFRHRKD